MPTQDTIIARWRANAAAAGVRLTEEDIARIVEAGAIEGVHQAEARIERIAGPFVLPDFLSRRDTDEQEDADD